MIESDLPLVTFVLLTYNQEDYIREAVQAAVCQEFSSIEIILSDDCSTDGTFDIMREFVKSYNGPHKIILNRTRKNLGICGHLNSILKIAQGEIIINAAGDDISLPNRTKLLYERFLADGEKTVAVFSNAEVVNFQGDRQRRFFRVPPKYSKNIDEFMVNRNCWALGCTFAFRKNIFDKYGALDSSVFQEDGLLAFRSLLEGELGYVDELLVKYRIHDSNVSNIENPKKLLILQRNVHRMNKIWLDEAIKFKGENRRLVSILRREYIYSRIKGALFSIPLIGYTYNYALLGLVKVVRVARNLASNEL
ncbi:glycosyltransferase [Simplicispira suum]|uniref:glycosyltransferase n=1 Tax=Simplicispira suum TaxID=2109915 RepID=UPI0014737D95|nr:glycosyltransferase [Simplicispira suum]